MALVIVLAGVLVANVIPDGPTGHLAYAQTTDSSIEFAENGTSPVAPFFAYDQDGDAIVWSLSGPDADQFTIDGGVLAFREPPNYEDPQTAATGVPLAERNVYRVTIEAGGGTHEVAVTVTDVDEAGTASMNRLQPQVSRPLGASLSDEDEVVSGQRWQWARSEDRTTWSDIEGATSPRRSPAEADEGMYLRATVTYSDKFGAGKIASAVSARRVEARTLSNAITVDEGTPSAECRNDTDIRDVGGWARIEGASSSAYVPSLADVDRCLRATAFYTDNLDDAERQATGVLEAPVQDSRPANAAPRFVDQDLNSPGDQSDRTSRKIAENTDPEESIGTPVGAMDDDGELLIYTLDGADASFFSISRNNGQIMTKASLNYEARNSYSVVVTATDPSGAADSIDVTINVTNVHDPVHITGVRSVRYPENGTDPLASFTAFDEAEHVIRWSVSGCDDDLFTIDDGVLAFREPPNYEDPQSAEDCPLPSVRNVYRVTVEAAGGRRSVTVAVTDVDEAGVANIDRPQPQVSRPLVRQAGGREVAVGEVRKRKDVDGHRGSDIAAAEAGAG